MAFSSGMVYGAKSDRNDSNTRNRNLTEDKMDSRRDEWDAMFEWAKDRCSHCQVAVSDFITERRRLTIVNDTPVPVATICHCSRCNAIRHS